MPSLTQGTEAQETVTQGFRDHWSRLYMRNNRLNNRLSVS